MRPGDKTRAPLRFGRAQSECGDASAEADRGFSPDLARIGASLKLGALNASGILHLDATTLGRNAPLFEDGLGLSEPHISRRALMPSTMSAVFSCNESENSYIRLGPEKSIVTVAEF